MKRIWEDFVVTGFGAATSYATAFAIVKFKLTFHSATLAYIFPIGAIMFGFLGALGYYWGAKLFDHRPTKLLGVNIVLVAASTYFLIYWMEYDGWEKDGIRLRDRMEFSQYLDQRLCNMALEKPGHRRTSSEPGAIGNWGYAWGLLQMAGFSLGGLVVFGFLRGQNYCERCSRYFVGDKEQFRIHETPEEFQSVTAQTASLLEAQEFQTAIANHAALASKSWRQALAESDLNKPVTWKLLTKPDRSSEVTYRTQFNVSRCPKCTNRYLTFNATATNGGDTKNFAEFHTFTAKPVEIL